MRKTVSRIVSILLSAALVMLTLAGCGKKQETSSEVAKKDMFPVTITDVYESKTTIDKMPERIVALAPSIVEVLYKLGLQDKIIGVTEFCDYPEEAKSKPKVGDFNGLNMEKIIEAKPDIILAGAGMSKEQYQQLVGLNLKVIVAEARTVAQVPATFEMIGSATGTADKAKALADELTGKINAIKDKAKDAKKVKAYYVVSFGKDNWTSGKGTFISDLINMAGGENISDDVESWADYSLEKIVDKNPEIILLSSMVAVSGKNTLDNEKGYKDTLAVKNGKVMTLDDNLVQRPGPRIAEGLEIIAKAIHPEIFNK